MYLDPIVLFREYIQNSLDSIDEAVEIGLFANENEGIIEIELDKSSNRITIQDNGIGVPENRAIKTLLDIGNSQKFQRDRRGFRGIGRLAGLGYSDRLVFETSYKGENVSTSISFDSLRLRELLVPGLFEEYDMMAVLREVTSVTTNTEEPLKHYFRITLEGIQSQEVIDKEIVAEYISEVAPVPYSPNRFSYADHIHKAFEEENIRLREYKIFLRNPGERWQQVFKFNRDQLLADRQRKIWDHVSSIQINKIYNNDGVLCAISWYANTGFLGTIHDKSIKGLRLRKGNILIGDETTLNPIFKEPRFNGWFQGEVFVLDSNIVPNARRDNFERNQVFDKFYLELINFGDKLSKLIREVSSERNNIKAQSNVIDANDIEINNIEKPFLLSHQGEKVNSKHQSKLIDILKRSSNNPVSKYSALNIADNLTYAEKRLLERVFNVLECSIEEKQRGDIISKILNEFSVV